MNLTWHIVKKDLRALRWPLAVWALLIVAKLGVGVILLTADGTESQEWFTRMDGMSKMLAVFECVSFVLAAAVIQQDLLVGTKSFWQTRPISGGRLLRAKLVLIGLVFGLLPLLITVPWWVGCGFGLREIGWAALETAAIHAACVLLGILWAAVTDGFGRFLMWTIVTLFAIPSLSGTLGYYLTRGKPGPSGELLTTRFALGAAIAAAGILIVVIHQFLTRRTGRSIALIGATGLVIVLVGACWPWSAQIESRLFAHFLHQEEQRWTATPEPAGLAFTVAPAQLSVNNAPARNSQLLVKFQVAGLTESQALRSFWSEYGWRWADGTTKQGDAWGRSGFGELAAERALGVAMKLAPAGHYTDTVTTIAWLDRDTTKRLLAESPAYAQRNRLQLLRFDSATPVPLQGGGRTLNGVLGERVAHVEKSGEELLVTFIRHFPSMWLNNFRGGYYIEYEDLQYSQYLLVNRAKGVVDRGRTAGHQSTRIGAVTIDWHTQSYRASKNAGGARPVLEAINALNDAELMRVTFVEQARFIHEIKIDPLVVEAPSNP